MTRTRAARRNPLYRQLSTGHPFTSHLPVGPGARLLAVLAALTTLSACFDGLGGTGGFAGFGGSGRAEAPVSVAVAEGAVTVAGPRGYCIDEQATRDTREGAVVLLGACDALGASTHAPDHRAVLTASISPRTDEWPAVESALAALAAFLGTEAGRAALSRSGRADTVEVLSTEGRDGVLFLHARDTSGFRGPRIAPEYWRAIFNINGRIATLSIMAAESAPLTDAAGRGLLEAFLQQMQRENRGR